MLRAAAGASVEADAIGAAVVLVAESVALVAAVSHYRGDEVTCCGAVIVPEAIPFAGAVCCCFDLFECHLVGSFGLLVVSLTAM